MPGRPSYLRHFTAVSNPRLRLVCVSMQNPLCETLWVCHSTWQRRFIQMERWKKCRCHDRPHPWQDAFIPLTSPEGQHASVCVCKCVRPCCVQTTGSFCVAPPRVSADFIGFELDVGWLFNRMCAVKVDCLQTELGFFLAYQKVAELSTGGKKVVHRCIGGWGVAFALGCVNASFDISS